MSSVIQIPRYGRCYSPVTLKLIDRLKDGHPGDVITDEQLHEVCGHRTAVNHAGYTNLLTAMRYVRGHFHKNWQRVHGAGAIKCLNSVETLDRGDSNRRMIRRKAVCAMNELRTIDPEQIEGRGTEYNALIAQSATLILFADHGVTKKLQAREKEKPYDPTEALEHWPD